MKLYLFACALFVFSSSLFAEIAVIVHPSNANALTSDQVSKIFLGRDKTFPDGSQAVPVALAEGLPATDTFNTELLKRNSSQLKAYWSKLVFTGKGTPPKEFASDTEMVKLIAANPNLIGYVNLSAADASVKVVLKL